MEKTSGRGPSDDVRRTVSPGSLERRLMGVFREEKGSSTKNQINAREKNVWNTVTTPRNPVSNVGMFHP